MIPSGNNYGWSVLLRAGVRSMRTVTLETSTGNAVENLLYIVSLLSLASLKRYFKTV